MAFLQDAEATLERIYRRPVQLDPRFVARKQPLPNRTFLSRMLNNLKQVGRAGWWLGGWGSHAAWKRAHALTQPRRPLTPPCCCLYRPRRRCTTTAKTTPTRCSSRST